MNTSSMKKQAAQNGHKKVSPKHQARNHKKQYVNNIEQQREKEYYNSLTFGRKWKYDCKKGGNSDTADTLCTVVRCICGITTASSKSFWRIVCIIKWFLIALGINWVLNLVIFKPFFEAATPFKVFIAISSLIFGAVFSMLDSERKSEKDRANKMRDEKKREQDNVMERSQSRSPRPFN